MLQTALALIQHGLAVFPCRQRSKLPATAHGCWDASLDSDTVRAWWATNPHLNIAIATGTTSNCFVLDVDGLDGQRELDKLEARHGELPRTLTAITPNHGMHLYFRPPPGVPVRNSASRIAPGMDVRGEGGYVLAPPSVHPNGRRCAWSVDSGDTIAAPASWLVIGNNVSDIGSRKPVEYWRSLAATGADEGARHCRIAQFAGYLLRRYVAPDVVLPLIHAWNEHRCRPPLPADEVTRIVTDIAAREETRRNGYAG